MNPNKLKDKDKDLIKEIKKMKKLQKGLYKEYEIPELEGTEED